MQCKQYEIFVTINEFPFLLFRLKENVIETSVYESLKDVTVDENNASEIQGIDEELI